MNVMNTEMALDSVVELPQRLETAAFWSPVFANLSQSALALNAVNIGGDQHAFAQNMGEIEVVVS